MEILRSSENHASTHARRNPLTPRGCSSRNLIAATITATDDQGDLCSHLWMPLVLTSQSPLGASARQGIAHQQKEPVLLGSPGNVVLSFVDKSTLEGMLVSID